MAAVPLAISGVIYDKADKSAKNVFLIGLSYNPSLQIGGGPIIPPEQMPPEVDPPLVIWGDPGGYNPDAPGQPWPEPPEGEKPPFEAKVAWTEETGWVVVLVPTGAHPTPSRKRG